MEFPVVWNLVGRSEAVAVDELRTYAEALALFHLSPEDKFENGGPWDIGPTVRRHVRGTGVQLIGKEANKVGMLERLIR